MSHDKCKHCQCSCPYLWLLLSYLLLSGHHQFKQRAICQVVASVHWSCWLLGKKVKMFLLLGTYVPKRIVKLWRESLGRTWTLETTLSTKKHFHSIQVCHESWGKLRNQSNWNRHKNFISNVPGNVKEALTFSGFNRTLWWNLTYSVYLDVWYLWLNYLFYYNFIILSSYVWLFQTQEEKFHSPLELEKK